MIGSETSLWPGLSVCRLVGLSAIISKKGEKLHFQAPIGAPPVDPCPRHNSLGDSFLHSMDACPNECYTENFIVKISSTGVTEVSRQRGEAHLPRVEGWFSFINFFPFIWQNSSRNEKPNDEAMNIILEYLVHREHRLSLTSIGQHCFA